MPLRNFVEDLEYSDNHGCDTTSPLPMLREGYVANLLNGNTEKSGGYSKRQGYIFQLGTAWGALGPGLTGTEKIRNGIEYKTTGGSSQIVLISDTKVGRVSAGAVIDIAGLTFTTGHRAAVIQFNNLLFFYNGFNNPMLWNGSVARQVGIVRPAAAPVIANSGTAGSLVTSAQYIWAYTYYNILTRAESSPSDLSTSMAPTGTSVDITFVASLDPQVTEIHLYRTVANGSVLFFVTSVSNAAGPYNDGDSDASLTYQMELDNSRITDFSSTAIYPTVVRNRVFVKTADNEVRFSKIGQFGPMPESFEVKGLATTTGRFGNTDFIVGLNSVNGIPIVLKRKTVGRLEEQGLPDNTQSFDLVGYTYRELAESYGAVSHYGAITIYNELLYLGYTGIFATNGMNVRPVANLLEKTIKALDLSSNKPDYISSVNDEQNKRVYFAVWMQGSLTPDFLIVGCYDDYPEFKWTFYTKGPIPSQWPSFDVGCFFKVVNTSTGLPEVYYGNALTNGQYYKMNQGDSDRIDSTHEYGIYFQLTTRPYFMKEPLVTKLFERSRIFVQGGVDKYNISVAAIYDLGISVENAQLYPIGAVGGTWDDYNWGWTNPALDDANTLIWANLDVTPIVYCGHTRAKFQQLVVTQGDKDAPVTILGWGTSAAMQAPR